MNNEFRDISRLEKENSLSGLNYVRKFILIRKCGS